MPIKKTTAIKIARVASLSGLKTLSFPLTVRCMSDKPMG